MAWFTGNSVQNLSTRAFAFSIIFRDGNFNELPTRTRSTAYPRLLRAASPARPWGSEYAFRRDNHVYFGHCLNLSVLQSLVLGCYLIRLC